MVTLTTAGSTSARRRFALLAVLAATIPLAALHGADGPKAKETPSPALPPYVKNVDVSITNLDVIVTDSKGNRVIGLTKDDFEVIEDNLKQSVTNFYAVDAGRVVRVGDEVVPTP